MLEDDIVKYMKSMPFIIWHHVKPNKELHSVTNFMPEYGHYQSSSNYALPFGHKILHTDFYLGKRAKQTGWHIVNRYRRFLMEQTSDFTWGSGEVRTPVLF